jgi:hypothetical protein
MTRRTKTYIAFDGDSDLMSYRTIQSWSADPSTPFTLNDAHDINYARDDSLPESIKSQLKERLDASRNFVLIIGSQTNKNRRGILQYEIRYALTNDLPIILAYKGYSGEDRRSDELWRNKLQPMLPAVLREWTGNRYCLVSPFTKPRVVHAIVTYSSNNLPQEGYTWNW